MQAMDIIAVNTNAVDLMRQGSFQKAIFFFRAALRELHLITGAQKQNMNTPPTDEVEMSRTFRREVSSVPLGDALLVLKPSIYQDHDAFSIFDRAFLIDSSDLVSVHSVKGQNYATTVLLFNMGLAYQLLGMQDFRSQCTSLKKAMKIYQMTVAMLENSGGEENGLICLALSNNMSHIYTHFCETQESQRCLDCLQENLIAIHNSNVEILVDEFRAFQMNVLLMHRKRAVAAAAA
jgi:tetratricopeptide (TPR) repeat protein